MAYIIFVNGKTEPIDSVKAIKMHLILKGQRPGTPEQLEYLEKVERISFNAKRSMTLPKPQVEQGRLPYND